MPSKRPFVKFLPLPAATLIAEQWIVENKEAIQAFNARVEAHGLPLANYRQF